jgi:hypothetical protein
MDTVLKKQTTSIFRVPPEDANSNSLCENMKPKTEWMVHAGKTGLQVPHYVLNQHYKMYVAALCTPSVLQFLLSRQMKQQSKRI